ncbi:MAG: purine-nucleoside phosphorylase [Myxococcales bacterium]|nr:purine-nucleoside phosphorylase [Myxococcales bacterium]MCB9715355.1 purine-nucleoside phosphorylase [Myxococcales bacterium]
MSEQARKAAAVVAEAAPGFRPRVGLTLGSGLGALAERVENAIVVDFRDLPGFPEPSVEGHHGRLVLGRLGGQDVACLQGRVHLYEGHPAQAVVPLVRTLKLLGCETYFATNAAGALDRDAEPGQLMLITDHINMQFANPLVGPNDESFGPRFPPMDGAYDAEHQALLRRVADDLGVTLREGVYLATLGPSFESHAEVRAFARLGANAVGMSTVPEVIVARHCGLRVAAISVLTNLAAGLSDMVLSHEQTLQYGHAAADDLRRLVLGFLEGLPSASA